MKPRFDHNWTDYARSIGYADEKDMLTDMYVIRELSLTQIADRLQCGTHTVNRHLNALNVTKRSRGGCNSQSNQTRKLFWLDQRIIHKLALNRLSQEVGVSPSMIYKYRRLVTRLPEDDVWNSVSSVPSQGLNDMQP